jgi:hypothetical protein
LMGFRNLKLPSRDSGAGHSKNFNLESLLLALRI